MTVRNRVLVALVATALLPLVAFVWFAQGAAFAGLEARCVAELQSVGRLQAQRVADALEAHRDRLALVVSRTQLRLALRSHLQQPADEQVARMERILRDARDALSAFERISLADGAGRVQASTDPGERGRRIPDGPALAAALEGQHETEFRVNAAGILELYLYGPLELEGDRLGVAEVRVRTDDIRTMLAGEAAIAGSRSRLLDVGGASVRSLVPARRAGVPWIVDDAGGDLLAGELRELYRDARDPETGAPLFAAVARVPGLELAVLTLIDEHAALAAAYRVRDLGWELTAGLAVVVVLVAFLLSRSVLRPIGVMQTAVRRFARGELEERVEVEPDDELGELAEGLNHMASELEATWRQQLSATAALESSNEDLDRFAALASHDLTAPLRAIRNLTTWIAEDAGELLPEASREHLAQLQGRGARMQELIEDLLDYARGGSDLGAPEAVDGRALVQGIVDELLQVPPNFTITIHAIPTLHTYRVPLEVCLRNLVTNAVKHHGGERGRIDVTCRVDGDFAVFTVADDGRGIDPHHHARAFEMLQSVRPGEGDGSGLGLALVKRLAERVGGRIELESEVGQGARFFLTFPVNQPAGQA